MSNLYVMAHKRTIGSGKALADGLGGTCITPKRTRPLKDGVLINYGVSFPNTIIREYKGRVLNSPGFVAQAVNKHTTLQVLEKAGVPTLEFTTDKATAVEWLVSMPAGRVGSAIFGRDKLSGKAGAGIQVFTDASDIFDSSCKLYTKNFPKTKEYRVHVVGGTAVSIYQKRAMGEERLAELGLLKADRRIRSHDRGWVFSIDIDENPKVPEVAVQAVQALGLDFGGVDVLADKHGYAVVCEVNTAPGLKGDTSTAQVFEAFKMYLSQTSQEES